MNMSLGSSDVFPRETCLEVLCRIHCSRPLQMHLDGTRDDALPGSDLRQTSLATGPLERPWEHTIPRSCLPTPSVTARSSTSWSTLACEPYKSDFS